MLAIFHMQRVTIEKFQEPIAISHLNHNVQRHETLDVHVYTQPEICPLADTNMQLQKKESNIYSLYVHDCIFIAPSTNEGDNTTVKDSFLDPIISVI